MAKSLPPAARKRSPRTVLATATVTALATVLVAPAAAAAPVPRAAALVSTPVSLTGAHWIWYADPDPATSAPAATRYLSRTFTAPAGPWTDAQLVVTGDDTVDVWHTVLFFKSGSIASMSFSLPNFATASNACRSWGWTRGVF